MCSSVFSFLSSELAGGTPHAVRCNIKSSFDHLLDKCVAVCFLFFHLNWRVAHLMQFDVTSKVVLTIY